VMVHEQYIHSANPYYPSHTLPSSAHLHPLTYTRHTHTHTSVRVHEQYTHYPYSRTQTQSVRHTCAISDTRTRIRSQ